MSAGLEIDTSKQTILRMEDGQPTKVSTPQLKTLLDRYRVRPEVRAEALQLWDEVRQQAKAAQLQGTYKGWWQAYADQYAPHFDHYLRLEDSANRMTTHQLVLVHGLLQTPDYRRAIIQASIPDISPTDLDRRLEVAAHRQERLTETGFRFEALLSEAVPRHLPGGPAVMIGQLRRLIEIGEQDNISIRIVPFAAGMHGGLVALSFTLLEFPPLASRLVEPPVAYIDGSEGALYLEHADALARFRRAITDMRHVALDEDDTRDLMVALIKEYSA